MYNCDGHVFISQYYYSYAICLPCEQLVSPTPNDLVWRRNQLLAGYYMLEHFKI